MKFAFALAATTALVLPAAANATTYVFTVAPILGTTGAPLDPNEGRTFTFTIGDTEVPTIVPGLTNPNYRAHAYSFTEFGSTTPVLVSAAPGHNIAFDISGQGGLSLTNSGVRNFFVFNTQLFDTVAYATARLTNPAAQPVFFTNTFRLSTIAGNGGPRPTDNYTVTIAVSPAVPEPTTWAMMIAGFGMIGGAMRRRTTRVRFA